VLHDMVTNKSTDGQIANEIEKDMCMVYRIVGICLDIPQQTFKWYVRNGRTCSYQVITPLQFYETVVRPVFNFDDKVTNTVVFKFFTKTPEIVSGSYNIHISTRIIRFKIIQYKC